MSRLGNVFRDLVYPGLDLHTRNRAALCRYWRSGPRDVLDAGSGNGYFSWLAYRSGARVVAINVELEQVKKARSFLIDHRGADPEKLRFEVGNLEDLRFEKRQFDEIIHYETLEHIRRDKEVCRQFFRILRPNGILHLCCPYRLHPQHRSEVLDEAEKGGHVRAGYTAEDYHKLLEPIGFEIAEIAGVGPPSVVHADSILRAIRASFGDILALLLLPIFLPVVRRARNNPDVPFSLYVKAFKPANGRA